MLNIEKLFQSLEMLTSFVRFCNICVQLCGCCVTFVYSLLLIILLWLKMVTFKIGHSCFFVSDIQNNKYKFNACKNWKDMQQNKCCWFQYCCCYNFIKTLKNAVVNLISALGS